jgi:hypothetical protein
MCARLYLWASTCHETHTATDRAVWVHHCGDKRCAPQQSLMIVVPGRIFALMIAGNVWAERSATRARQVSPNPAWHQQKCKLSRATGRNYTFAFWSIYHIFPQLCHPCQPPFKNSCKGQIKMKLNIALQQNCDQSATVWWSKWSSAKQWRVGEWCLTWNTSAQSNREPT